MVKQVSTLLGELLKSNKALFPNKLDKLLSKMVGKKVDKSKKIELSDLPK
jgi:hypothetical protein